MKDKYLLIYLLCFANFTQSYLHKYKHKNIQTINQSMAGYIYICYSFTPITAALTERTWHILIRSLVI